MTAYRYCCQNPDCKQLVFTEELTGFTTKYKRMTCRLQDFILLLALETSCEGTMRICKAMGIQVCGNTIIHMLKEKFETTQHPLCSHVIGVDDWAYRKGVSYGTLICDEATRAPIAVLEGRDGSELKKWLEQNKHIKVVTRDRATTYAKVISETLPDAMQIADRFHLHQNLLNTIKRVVRAQLPSTIKIPEVKETGKESSGNYEAEKKTKHHGRKTL